MTLDPVLQALVDTVIDNALPDVEPASIQQTAVVAMCKHLRPYIEVAMSARAPKHAAGIGDMRMKKWLISVEWYDVPRAEVIAMSEGRYTVGHGKNKEIRAYGGDMVRGLAGAADLLAEQAAQLGLPIEDYGRKPMLRAFENLRPTLSRQNGRGTMRRESTDGKWWVCVDVFREDVAPKDEVRQELRRFNVPINA